MGNKSELLFTLSTIMQTELNNNVTLDNDEIIISCTKNNISMKIQKLNTAIN